MEGRKQKVHSKTSMDQPIQHRYSPHVQPRRFSKINDYVSTSGQCWKMCLGKPCRLGEECYFQHHRAYRDQPWFTSDKEFWEGDVKYTWRTEAPVMRRSERNMEGQPKPNKQAKASSDDSTNYNTNYSSGFNNRKLGGPRTKEQRFFRTCQPRPARQVSPNPSHARE